MARTRADDEAHLEARRAQQAVYRATPGAQERRARYTRLHVERKRVYDRQYRAAHHAEKLVKDRAYYRAHRARASAKAAQYVASHRAAVLAYRKRWRERTRAQKVAKDAQARDRLTDGYIAKCFAVPVGTYSQDVMDAKRELIRVRRLLRGLKKGTA